MRSLDWKDYISQIVHAIGEQNVDQFRQLFFTLHVNDQIEVFNALDKKQRSEVFKYLNTQEFSEMFQDLEIEKQILYLDELPQNDAIEVLNKMHDGDLAEFLSALPDVKKEFYLSKMDAKEAEEVSQLMKGHKQTAGAIMTTEFVSISSNQTVGYVMAQLREQAIDADMIYYLYVVNEQEELVGVLSLRDLIVSSIDEIVENIMLTRVKYVETDEDQEEVARIFMKYHFLALPVVNPNGHLVGIITVDDIMNVVEEEAEEDLGEFVGGRGSLDTNISILSAAKKRAPWIVLMIFFGIGIGGIIEAFEETLEQYIILTAFIPLIMGAAGNTGTQALAVIVRKLAADGTDTPSALWKIIKREFKTGLMLGLICAVTMLITMPFIFPEGGVILAGIVGVSLFLTLCVSTIVGALVPVFISKLKIDPAVASGPFITTINDVVGLLIYFAISTTLLDYLS